MLSYPGTLDPRVKIIDFGHANFNHELRSKHEYIARVADSPEVLLSTMGFPRADGSITDKVYRSTESNYFFQKCQKKIVRKDITFFRLIFRLKISRFLLCLDLPAFLLCK
jgi:hypothetical protein